MIKFIKDSWSISRSVSSLAISSRSHTPTSNNLPYTLPQQINSSISASSKIFTKLLNSQVRYFSTASNKTDTYQKTGDEKDTSKDGNSLDSNKIVPYPKLINRLKQYSTFLSKKQNQSSSTQSNLLSTSKMQIQMIDEIDKNFALAGTNVQDISKSLMDIANRLESMLKESEALVKKYKNQDQKQYQKYKLRYQQYIKLLNKLNDEYYPQPRVTKIQPIQASLFLLDLETELNSVIQLLYGSIQQASPYFRYTPDIASDEPFSKNFEYAWSKVKIIQLDPATKKAHDMVYKILKKSVIMVTNAVVTEHTTFQWENQYWHKILFGLSFPVSLINLQKAELKCYKLWRRPNIEMVKHLLDLPQKGYIQHAKKIIYPSIKSNFFLYNHTAPKSTPDNKQSVHGSQVTAQQTNTNIFQNAQHSGRILLNAHENLAFKGDIKPEEKFSKLKKLFNFNFLKSKQTSKAPQEMQTVIIHMHGGGFIAMSSQLMQNHTRVWANQLHVPVFSLDYRKPPKHRFPEPLQDCVAGYKFIVEKIHNYLNIKPKNIILAGDSAGGNMACALQAQLMKQKYPILPKALFLMYPATDLRIRYTPSRLNSLSDGIFLPSLLMLCQEQYLGKNTKNQFDPLASPILLTESYINPQKKGTPQSQKWPQAWPKTVIFSGRKDPLFDDSIRLLQRLTRDGIQCKMRLYKDFSHGFMSMDQVLPGAKQAIKDSTQQLREIIKSL